MCDSLWTRTIFSVLVDTWLPKLSTLVRYWHNISITWDLYCNLSSTGVHQHVVENIGGVGVDVGASWMILLCGVVHICINDVIYFSTFMFKLLLLLILWLVVIVVIVVMVVVIVVILIIVIVVIIIIVEVTPPLLRFHPTMRLIIAS